MAMHLGEAQLQTGTSGAEVKELQQILTGQGYAVGPIDGIFGPRTQTAVQAFQRSKGLIPDGIVGPLTWEALHGKVPLAPAPLPGPSGIPVGPPPTFGGNILQTVALYGLGALAILVMIGSKKKTRR